MSEYPWRIERWYCVKCIYTQQDLRIDYTYEVINDDEEHYLLENDKGIEMWYDKRYFVEI